MGQIAASKMRAFSNFPLALRQSKKHGVFSIGILIVLLLQLGCSPQTAPMSDAVQAKVLVQKMLEEWKSGASVDEVKKRNPPVYVTEDLWRSGATLNEYTLIDDSEALGSNIRLKVKLKCTSKNGKAIERSVRYIVTTQPALTMVREEG